MRAFAAHLAAFGAKSRLPAVLTTAVVCVFAYATLAANSDLAVGRFALHMDERLTFDGVKAILDCDGLQTCLWAIADGGDQRYGRILWNSMATASVLPERLWGEPGQIIASRMLQVLLLGAAGLIFAFALVRNAYLRVVVVLSVLAMPFAEYFMTMPKPEPQQLLFLALFCAWYFRTEASFGWYWVFAGLALGAKVSTAPIVLVLAIAAVVVNLRHPVDGRSWRSVEQAAVAFLAGLAAAVPLLVVPLFSVVGAWLVLTGPRPRSRPGVAVKWVVAVCGVALVHLLSRGLTQPWIVATFENTTHGSDQASVTAVTWLRYFTGDWMVAPKALAVVVLVLVAAYLALQAVEAWRPGPDARRRAAALAIALAGAALMAAIMLRTHRLWGYYLYPGMVLAVVGVLALVDLDVGAAPDVPRGGWRTGTVGVACAVLIGAVAAGFWAPHALGKLRELAQRTQSPRYIAEYRSYRELLALLEIRSGSTRRTLNVALDPELFLPEDCPQFRIRQFWGPFVEWTGVMDAVVLGPTHLPSAPPIPPDSPNYEAWVVERMGWSRFVGDEGGSCRAPRCFRVAANLPNGGVVLVTR